MANYNDVFGAFTVPPAEATYSRLTLNDSGTLAWPANFSGEVAGQYLATSVLEISAAAGLQLLLPPANEASVGQDLVIRNVGAESIDLFDAEGGPITTLVTGESKYIYITNNSTAAGTWSMFTYGAGTSGADAALLAGEGLQVAGNTIQVAAVHRGLDSNYQIVEEDRGQLLNVEVGTITVTTPDATAVASGFYCFMRNSALGNASVVPFSGQSINGVGAWTLSPGDSLILMSTGTNWVTVGFGQNVNFTFTELVVNAAAGDATLSSSDVSGRMIRITGTATASIVLTLPSVDNIYFVNVESGMGAYTVTLKTPGVGGVVVLNANEKTALYSDGVNVTIAITTTVTSTLSLTDGGPTAPSLFFALDTDTGLYRKTNDTIGFTAGGAERMALSPAGLTLQTALPVAQGGTGATTAGDALTNLGATTNTRTLTAGNGLTGGGDLTADRTLALGTPGTLSGSTTNAVTATSHTHAISAATDALSGVVELATDAETQAGTDTARAVTPAGLAAALANKANSTGSYPGLNVGWAQYANQLRPPAGDGVLWPNDAFGGSGDTASIVLANEGGEAQRMRFSLSNDPDDYFEFVAASVDGLKVNGHTVLNAANWGNYAASKTSVVELATDAETQAGTDTARAVTPAGLSSRTATETRTGVVELATTAEVVVGMDTTRAVTAAGVAAAILSAFPVGSVYITASNINPATFLGGTWSQIAQGRALIGVGTLGTDTYAAGNEGGAARVTLTTTEMPSHNHGGATGGSSSDHSHSGTTSASGNHTHSYYRFTGNTSGSQGTSPIDGNGPTRFNDLNDSGWAGDHAHSFTTGGISADHTHAVSAQGGGLAHENRMPYLAVYFWQRTA